MLGQLTAMMLGASNVLLALVVFVLMARPERTLGWLCFFNGMHETWIAGRLSEQDETRLLTLARRLGGPALFLLFGWSFVCGALLTWAQLG